MLDGHERPIRIAFFVDKVVVSVRQESRDGPLGGSELNFYIPPARMGVLQPFVQFVGICKVVTVYLILKITCVVAAAVTADG